MRKKFVASALAATLAINFAYHAQATTSPDTLVVVRNIADLISLDSAETRSHARSAAAHFRHSTRSVRQPECAAPHAGWINGLAAICFERVCDDPCD